MKNIEPTSREDFIRQGLTNIAKICCMRTDICEDRFREVQVIDLGIDGKGIVNFVFFPELNPDDQAKFDRAVMWIFTNAGLAGSIQQVALA